MKDKKYTIEVTQTSKRFDMLRENSGFTIYELIGFVELIRNELVQQAVSMFDNSDIKRTFNAPNSKGEITKGEIKINLKEDN